MAEKATAPQKSKGLWESPFTSSLAKRDRVTPPEVIFGYFLGPFGGLLASGIFTSQLQNYFTDVLRLDLSFLTALQLVSTVLIVIANLMVGQLIERTHCLAGKARPWILLSALTLAVSTVLMFFVPFEGMARMVWIAIAYCQIVFRRRWLESGHSTSELKYRTPGYPYVSWAAFILCTASFVLVIFDVEQRFALVAELVFIVACYGAYFLQQWVRKRKKATEADDLDTLWVARD